MQLSTRAEITKDEVGEWKPFCYHWISSLGKVKNCFGKTKCLSSDGRYFLDKDNNIYVGALLAQVFQIEGYEKLKDSSFCVTRIDLTKDITVDNIKIVPKSEIGERNGKKSRQSETFKDKMTWLPNITEKSNLSFRLLHFIHFRPRVISADDVFHSLPQLQVTLILLLSMYCSLVVSNVIPFPTTSFRSSSYGFLL
jgi:hypothetical protein